MVMDKITTEHLLGQLDRVKPHLVFDDYAEIKRRLLLMEEFIKRAALITTKTSDVPYPSEDRYKDAWALARDIANADKGGQ